MFITDLTQVCYRPVRRLCVRARRRSRVRIATSVDKKLGQRLIMLNVVPAYAYRFWVDLC